MLQSTILAKQDDHTLAALAVEALQLLAHRKRHGRDYEVIAHVAGGAAMVESRILPDRPTKAPSRSK